MRFLDEYRDAAGVRRLAAEIHRRVTRPWTIMEVCGGQTHSIVRFGIDELLPPEVTLAHGPGCPVCVTPTSVLDVAHQLALRPEVIFCSFGDMLRVPGSGGDLFSAKAAGADVRVVYSPLDALALAERNPDREVVFFAVGFETTAPAAALLVHQAAERDVPNLSLLVSHVLVPPAMEAILSSAHCRVQGFLAAGHVCTVMGHDEYEPIAEKYRVPIVVTGFEPIDLLQGILLCVTQLEEGRAEVENPYSRIVRRHGNEPARELIGRVFEVRTRTWRGMGEIGKSGLGLGEEYARFDAERRFQVRASGTEPHTECISGLVLQGRRKPRECPAFGTTCTPERPIGATMVSSEGACAAYFRYRGAEVAR